MNQPALPSIICERHHPRLAVSDVPAAVQFYSSKLGFHVAFTSGDPPTMAGVNLDKVQIFLEQGSPNSTCAGVYFLLGAADELSGGGADELYEFHRAAGVEIIEPPTNRPYGIRDYTVRDVDGYHLTFGHRLLNAGPPLKIERVAVPLRLEKRLAVLLRDLAEHKGMRIDSCLEEILLHTCEPLGNGVASPHSKRTMEFIQDLKKKHGIDYDAHASYRFVEE